MFNNIKLFFHHEDKDIYDNRIIFASMLFGAALSLLAAFVLSTEAVWLAMNPNAHLSCSINVVLNCATVAKTSFAMLLGFPNSFIGLMSEPVVITVAMAGLAGVKFPRRFMFVAQIFYTLGFMFAYFLTSISTFVIHALCPWCLLVTLATTLVFFSMTRYNIREDNLYLSKRISKRAKEFIEKDYDKLVLASIIAIVIAVIIIKYGNNGLFS
jgi:uncharacterized membrane protein